LLPSFNFHSTFQLNCNNLLTLNVSVISIVSTTSSNTSHFHEIRCLVFPHAPWLSVHIHCNMACFRSRLRGQLYVAKTWIRCSSAERFYEKSNTYITRYQTSLPVTCSRPLPFHFTNKIKIGFLFRIASSINNTNHLLKR
jgi:hypothetical protein